MALRAFQAAKNAAQTKSEHGEDYRPITHELVISTHLLLLIIHWLGEV